MEVATKTEAAPAKSAIGLVNLKHALKIVSAAINRNAVIPVLQGIRIEQLSNGLALESTDLDVYIRAVVPETCGPQKATVIPAEKLIAWTKLLDGDDVKISTTDARATVSCGRARAVLPILSASGWPNNDVYDMKADGVTLTQGSFARALKFALISVSTEEGRYTLNGVQIYGDGERLHLVATNGHCLTLYTLPCSEKIELLLPSRIIKALLPLLTDDDGGVDLVYSQNMILASIDAETRAYVGGTRITGAFPAWQAVMPKDERTDVVVKAPSLMAALQRCMLLSDEKSGAIDLLFGNGEIVLHAADAQHGESDESVACVGSPTSELRIRVAGAYLSSLLSKLDGELTVALPSNGAQALLLKAKPHDDETVDHIVMPMRI